MIMALELGGKEMIHSLFCGLFAFLHLQKLTNVLTDANEEFQNYMVRKLGGNQRQILAK